MKSAVAIGGGGALAAVLEVEGLTGRVEGSHGRTTFADRQNRQHAWADYLAADPRGIPAPPRHHVLLFLDYARAGEPRVADRGEMEGALRQLERAFEWSNEGLLFTTNYSREYFDRFDEDLPSGVNLRRDEDIIATTSRPDESPVGESYDLFIDLASDNAANALAAEEALWGNDRYLNGVEFDETFEGVFDRPTAYPDRRTGFVGNGAPANQLDNENIPDDAPLSMGFQSVMEDNVPSEDLVAMVHDQRLGPGNPMPPGVFAQGTIQTANNLSIDIDSWYADNDLDGRMARMFSPHHDPDEFGPIGNQQTTSGTDDLPMRDVDAGDDIARRTKEDAENLGIVGHAQKLARARFDLTRRDTDGQDDDVDDTTVLRRDFNTTDVAGASSGLHFLSLMRFNNYFIYVRRSMNGVGFESSEEIVAAEDTAIDHDDVDIPVENDGFLGFVTALRRGNFMMPPLSLRSLPPARGAEVQLDLLPPGPENEVDLSDRYVPVGVQNTGEHPGLMRHVGFGAPTQVNQLRGADLREVDRVDYDDDGDHDWVLWFRTDETGLTTGDDRARLLLYDSRGEPIYGDVAVDVVS